MMDSRDRQGDAIIGGDEWTQEGRSEADAAGRSEEGRGRSGQRAQAQGDDEAEEAKRHQKAVAFLREYFTTEDWPTTVGEAEEALAGALCLLRGEHLPDHLC